jgi:hypothetical protein
MFGVVAASSGVLLPNSRMLRSPIPSMTAKINFGRVFHSLRQVRLLCFRLILFFPCLGFSV